MKALLTILAVLTTTFIVAQETVYWVGGTPGQETSWHVASNWSSYSVPNEFSNVVINNPNSGHHAQPVISQFIEVLSISILNGAQLEVSADGGILIDGNYAYTEGLQIQGGHLINDGDIQVLEIDGILENNWLTYTSGIGQVTIDDEKVQPSLAASR